MKKYTKTYLEFFGYCKEDVIICEVCGKGLIGGVGGDIHHIKYRSHGGSDDITNCMALCSDCHSKAHNEEYKQEFLQEIHCKFIAYNEWRGFFSHDI